jgi:hypothetical protein
VTITPRRHENRDDGAHDRDVGMSNKRRTPGWTREIFAIVIAAARIVRMANEYTRDSMVDREWKIPIPIPTRPILTFCPPLHVKR